MRQTMLASAVDAARDHLRVGRPHHQSAWKQEQRCATLAFELVPEFISAQQQRYVSRVLEVGLANHARAAMTRTPVVWWMKLLNPKNALAASREMTCRRAAHPAQAENDNVV